jgi:hypothetical protein
LVSRFWSLETGLWLLAAGFWSLAYGRKFQVSAQPPAKKTAGLIEKETLKKRITIIE